MAKRKPAPEPEEPYWHVYIEGRFGGDPVAYIHAPDEAAALAKARRVYNTTPPEKITVKPDDEPDFDPIALGM